MTAISGQALASGISSCSSPLWSHAFPENLSIHHNGKKYPTNRALVAAQSTHFLEIIDEDPEPTEIALDVDRHYSTAVECMVDFFRTGDYGIEDCNGAPEELHARVASLALRYRSHALLLHSTIMFRCIVDHITYHERFCLDKWIEIANIVYEADDHGEFDFFDEASWEMRKLILRPFQTQPDLLHAVLKKKKMQDHLERLSKLGHDLLLLEHAQLDIIPEPQYIYKCRKCMYGNSPITYQWKHNDTYSLTRCPACFSVGTLSSVEIKPGKNETEKTVQRLEDSIMEDVSEDTKNEEAKNDALHGDGATHIGVDSEKEVANNTQGSDEDIGDAGSVASSHTI